MKLYKIQHQIRGYSNRYQQLRIFLPYGHISVYRFSYEAECMYYADQYEHRHDDPNYMAVLEEQYISEDLTILSEEEFFQRSLTWDYPVDVFLLKRVQKFMKTNYPSIHTEDCTYFQTFGEEE